VMTPERAFRLGHSISKQEQSKAQFEYEMQKAQKMQKLWDAFHSKGTVPYPVDAFNEGWNACIESLKRAIEE
jgi:hypothetical protein